MLNLRSTIWRQSPIKKWIHNMDIPQVSVKKMIILKSVRSQISLICQMHVAYVMYSYLMPHLTRCSYIFISNMEYNHAKLWQEKKNLMNYNTCFCLWVCLSITVMSTKPISCYWSLCIPPENIRKPEVF